MEGIVNRKSVPRKPSVTRSLTDGQMEGQRRDPYTLNIKTQENQPLGWGRGV